MLSKASSNDPQKFYSFKNLNLLIEAFTLIPTHGVHNNFQKILEKVGDSFLSYNVTKLLYLETASIDKYTSKDCLHKLREFFTSNLFFSYIICQKMFLNKIKDDVVVDTDKKQKDRRKEFRDAVNRTLEE